MPVQLRRGTEPVCPEQPEVGVYPTVILARSRRVICETRVWALLSAVDQVRLPGRGAVDEGNVK